MSFKSSGVILEPATITDRDAVNAMAIQVHELHVGWQPQYYEHTGLLYDEARYQKALNDKVLYVARLDGQIVGYVTLPVIEFFHAGSKPMKTMKLEELCVADGYRGQGIGKQIMENVKSLAKEMGCTDIRLTCAPQNEAAISLYQGVGMEIKNLQYFLMI